MTKRRADPKKLKRSTSASRSAVQKNPNKRKPPTRRGRAPLFAVGVVVLAVAAMVALALTKKTGPSEAGRVDASTAARLAQSVPVPVLDSIGSGQGVTAPRALPANTSPVENAGKPEILYIGAEYCPYCAAQRWAIVVALSRFGSFGNLAGTSSSSTDIYPNTQTLTFYGSTYTSDTISFVPVETNTNQPAAGGGFTPLETLTADQQALLARYDVSPYTVKPDSIPFLMIGNRFLSIGSTYDPGVLQGMTRDQIASELSKPSSPVAQRVDGAANTLTAAICQLTASKPSSVCSDPAIQRISSTLPASP